LIQADVVHTSLIPPLHEPNGALLPVRPGVTV
jgi:hypothetical protein